jgi:hypothetical protein
MQETAFLRLLSLSRQRLSQPLKGNVNPLLLFVVVIMCQDSRANSHGLLNSFEHQRDNQVFSFVLDDIA